VLGFNRRTEVQAELGPFHEAITVVRSNGEAKVVAAANYSIMAYVGRARTVVGYDGSCQ
jgi:hypothetical protein